MEPDLKKLRRNFAKLFKKKYDFTLLYLNKADIKKLYLFLCVFMNAILVNKTQGLRIIRCCVCNQQAKTLKPQ